MATRHQRTLEGSRLQVKPLLDNEHYSQHLQGVKTALQHKNGHKDLKIIWHMFSRESLQIALKGFLMNINRENRLVSEEILALLISSSF